MTMSLLSTLLQQWRNKRVRIFFPKGYQTITLIRGQGQLVNRMTRYSIEGFINVILSHESGSRIWEGCQVGESTVNQDQGYSHRRRSFDLFDEFVFPPFHFILTIQFVMTLQLQFHFHWIFSRHLTRKRLDKRVTGRLKTRNRPNGKLCLGHHDNWLHSGCSNDPSRIHSNRFQIKTLGLKPRQTLKSWNCSAITPRRAPQA